MFQYIYGHSHYSLLEAIGSPDKILKTAKSYGYDHYGILDYNAMYGAYDIAGLSKKNDMKAIVGTKLLYVQDVAVHNSNIGDSYIILIAQNYEGYQNLLNIVTMASTVGLYEKARVDANILSQYSQGIICIIGGYRSIVSISAYIGESLDKITDRVADLAKIFPDSIYTEHLAQHYDKYKLAKTINQYISHISSKLNISTTVNNCPHYIHPEDKRSYEIALCIKDGKLIKAQDRRQILGDHHILTPSEMDEILVSQGLSGSEMDILYQNNQQIIDSIDMKLPKLDIQFPTYDSPPEIQALYDEYMSIYGDSDNKNK